MKYKHIFQRVEYPRERGYRMETLRLPPWMYIEVESKNDSKQLIVYSRIHVKKMVKLNPTYSLSFSDNAIIKDLSGKISKLFL